MTPQVDGTDRDHHDVAFPRADVLVAAGAEVGLDRLVGLYPPHFDLFGEVLWRATLRGCHRVQPTKAQTTRAVQTAKATATMR